MGCLIECKHHFFNSRCSLNTDTDSADQKKKQQWLMIWKWWEKKISNLYRSKSSNNILNGDYMMVSALPMDNFNPDILMQLYSAVHSLTVSTTCTTLWLNTPHYIHHSQTLLRMFWVLCEIILMYSWRVIPDQIVMAPGWYTRVLLQKLMFDVRRMFYTCTYTGLWLSDSDIILPIKCSGLCWYLLGVDRGKSLG